MLNEPAWPWDIDRKAAGDLVDIAAGLLQEGLPPPGGSTSLAGFEAGGLHLVRGSQASVWLVLSRRPDGRSPPQEAGDREALLRLSAQARWSDGLVGGLDPKGEEWLAVALDGASLPAELDQALARLLAAVNAGAQPHRPVGLGEFHGR